MAPSRGCALAQTAGRDPNGRIFAHTVAHARRLIDERFCRLPLSKLNALAASGLAPWCWQRLSARVASCRQLGVLGRSAWPRRSLGGATRKPEDANTQPEEQQLRRRRNPCRMTAAPSRRTPASDVGCAALAGRIARAGRDAAGRAKGRLRQGLLKRTSPDRSRFQLR